MFLGAILLCAQKSWWKVILPEQRRPNGERIYWGGSYTQTTGRTAVHVGSRWSQVPWTVPVASLVFTAFWKLSFSIYEHFCSFCQKVSLGVRVCVYVWLAWFGSQVPGRWEWELWWQPLYGLMDGMQERCIKRQRVCFSEEVDKFKN